MNDKKKIRIIVKQETVYVGDLVKSIIRVKKDVLKELAEK